MVVKALPQSLSICDSVPNLPGRSRGRVKSRRRAAQQGEVLAFHELLLRVSVLACNTTSSDTLSLFVINRWSSYQTTKERCFRADKNYDRDERNSLRRQFRFR